MNSTKEVFKLSLFDINSELHFNFWEYPAIKKVDATDPVKNRFLKYVFHKKKDLNNHKYLLKYSF